jgi:biopolymer transport protein ExbD
MPEVKEGGVNVTPLIDVVMCLIIFFMLVAKIGVSTGAVAMDLPETILGKKIEELGDSMILNVTDPNPVLRGADDRPIVDAKNRPMKKRVVSEPQVTALLDQNEREAKEIKLTRRDPTGNITDYPLRRVLQEAVKRNKEFSVTIRAEKDIDFGMLQQVLAEVANGGVMNTNYATKGKKVES